MDKILQGYILKISAYKEDSAIISLLTDSGIFTFTKMHYYSLKSRYKGILTLYSFVKIQCNQKTEESYLYFKDGLLVKSNSFLIESMDSYALLSLLSEVIIKFNGMKDDYIVFDDIYDKLLNGTYNYLTLLAYVLRLALLGNGINLNVNECVECGAKKIHNISYKKGGFVCKEHDQEPLKKNVEYLKTLHDLFTKNYYDFTSSSYSDEFLKELCFDLFEYLDSATGIVFKSAKIIKNLL